MLSQYLSHLMPWGQESTATSSFVMPVGSSGALRQLHHSMALTFAILRGPRRCDAEARRTQVQTPARDEAATSKWLRRWMHCLRQRATITAKVMRTTCMYTCYLYTTFMYACPAMWQLECVVLAWVIVTNLLCMPEPIVACMPSPARICRQRSAASCRVLDMSKVSQHNES